MSNLFHTFVLKISALIASAVFAFTGTAYPAPQSHAQTASVAIATEQVLPSGTEALGSSRSANDTQPLTSTTNTPTVVYKYLELPVAANPSDAVTQEQLAAVQDAINTIQTELYGSTSTIANGGLFGAIAASNRIDQLSDVTINDPTITGLSASDIPDLSGSYLSLNGGTLTGAFFDSSTTTSSFAGSLGIGTSTPDDLLSLYSSTNPGLEFSGSNSSLWTEGIDTSDSNSFEIASSSALGTNPRFVINGAGDVGIGTTTPSFTLDVNSGNGVRVIDSAAPSSAFPGFFAESYQNGFSGKPQFLFFNSQGTQSAPSPLLSGNGLGQIVWNGADNTSGGSLQTASISAASDENFSTTNGGTHLSFYTASLGGSVSGTGIVERMRITPNGAVGINTTVPAFQLDVRALGRISTTTFTGVGLNDASAVNSNYLGTDTTTDTYTIIIQTSGTPDTFEWQENGGAFTTGVAITGGNQVLSNGVDVKFASTTGHTVGDQWVITVTPENPFGVANSAGTRVLDVANNGEVGIDTSSPLGLLTIAGTLTASSWTTNGLGFAITGGTFTDNSSAANSTIATRAAYSLANPTFAFTNATSTITNAATLYIGGAPSAQASSTIITNALALDVNGGISYFGGNVGVNTTAPYAKLAVKGSDSASTTAFYVVNSASTTVFSVYDNGNATYSGSIFQSSDQRLKTNITSLSASSSLAALNELNPVSYNWIDPNQGSATQLGFIAQQVGSVFPNLVSTTSPTALTPDGTLTLNYSGLISPIVAAIQELSGEIASLAQSITTQVITAVTGNFSVGNFSNELCVGSTCVTPAQFQAMVAAAGQSGTPPPSQNDSSDDASTSPPVIEVNGDNPATINVGDTYSDLGAVITGPQADLNLGIQVIVDGGATTSISNISIDTSVVGSHEIEYVATDQNGLEGTATRTVIVQDSDSSSASSTDATSTNP